VSTAAAASTGVTIATIATTETGATITTAIIIATTMITTTSGFLSVLDFLQCNIPNVFHVSAWLKVSFTLIKVNVCCQQYFNALRLYM
jgi:hypothetical protein